MGCGAAGGVVARNTLFHIRSLAKAWPHAEEQREQHLPSKLAEHLTLGNRNLEALVPCI